MLDSLHLKVELVDLFPHLRVDLLAHLAGVLAAAGDAAHDRVCVVLVKGEQVGQVLVVLYGAAEYSAPHEAGDQAVAAPARGLDGLFGHDGEVNVELAGDMVGALHVAAHPVEAVGHAREHSRIAPRGRAGSRPGSPERDRLPGRAPRTFGRLSHDSTAPLPAVLLTG